MDERENTLNYLKLQLFKVPSFLNYFVSVCVKNTTYDPSQFAQIS